ncbi:MAG: hypothetical protein IJZ90_00100 [Clostridia bacterium]|nr:hypothetical protein [Clostridia bacterium]
MQDCKKNESCAWECHDAYSEVICLEATDTDLNNRWKVSSVVSRMHAVAGNHCVQNGWGWNDLKEKYGICLVLTRTHIHMDSYPECYTNVRIKTWPENGIKSIFTRYFEMENADTGERYGYASVQCVIMDMINRSIVRPDNLNLPEFGIYDIEPPCSGVPKLVIKKNLLGRSENSMHKRVPVYSELDYNGHVNNSKYIEWVCDLFEPGHYSDKKISEFDIKYNKETLYGNEVSLELIPGDENTYYVRGTADDGEEKDVCRFEASVKFI